MSDIERTIPGLEAPIRKAWQLLAKERRLDDSPVVRPSIPILWFGDLAAYLGSETKIITVGLNPSLHEFPPSDWRMRFPSIPDSARQGACETDLYIEALSNYFKTPGEIEGTWTSYDWFDDYDRVLRGMGASYRDQSRERSRGVALHTDFCSPLATNPTWDKLDKKEYEKRYKRAKKRLLKDGCALWQDLCDVLEPDLILTSMKKSYATRVARLQNEDDWESIFSTISEKGKENHIEAFRPGSGGGAITVWGRYVNRTFGTLSWPDESKLGETIAKDLL